MEDIEIVKPDKNILGLVKIILGQNEIILTTNKLLLEKLAAPPIILRSEPRTGGK